MLAFLAQLLPPLGIVVGVYMTWTGADHPGGAFQGGTVLAAMWILVIIAGLRQAPSIDQRLVRLLAVAGPAIFLGIGLAGHALADLLDRTPGRPDVSAGLSAEGVGCGQQG